MAEVNENESNSPEETIELIISRLWDDNLSDDEVGLADLSKALTRISVELIHQDEPIEIEVLQRLEGLMGRLLDAYIYRFPKEQMLFGIEQRLILIETMQENFLRALSENEDWEKERTEKRDNLRNGKTKQAKTDMKRKLQEA